MWQLSSLKMKLKIAKYSKVANLSNLNGSTWIYFYFSILLKENRRPICLWQQTFHRIFTPPFIKLQNYYLQNGVLQSLILIHCNKYCTVWDLKTLTKILLEGAMLGTLHGALVYQMIYFGLNFTFLPEEVVKIKRLHL